MNVPRAIGLAQALAHPPLMARTEEAALIQIDHLPRRGGKYLAVGAFNKAIEQSK